MKNREIIENYENQSFSRVASRPPRNSLRGVRQRGLGYPHHGQRCPQPISAPSGYMPRSPRPPQFSDQPAPSLSLSLSLPVSVYEYVCVCMMNICMSFLKVEVNIGCLSENGPPLKKWQRNRKTKWQSSRLPFFFSFLYCAFSIEVNMVYIWYIYNYSSSGHMGGSNVCDTDTIPRIKVIL